MLEIPKIENIPEFFYNYLVVEELEFLGFTKNYFGCFEKKYGNEENYFTPAVSDAGFEWAISIEFYTSNKRTLICPRAFSVYRDITLIELISVIYEEWKSAFGRKYIPNELLYGKTYIDYLQTLKNSRPKKPSIQVERDTFRFFINKIIKNNKIFNENFEIEFSCINNQLKIVAESETLYIPTLSIENICDEKIYVSAQVLFKGIPKRFIGNVVTLGVGKNTLRINNYIFEARWEGRDLWEYDEYDRLLLQKISAKSQMFLPKKY